MIKGGALNEVKKIMGLERSVVTIALGDSPNDQAMLNNADVAVVIPSSHSKDIVITNPIQIIYAEKTWPERLAASHGSNSFEGTSSLTER